MSDNKKYYYLKLVDNFYERDEMIILESMPDGYMYSNILLKLYLRSLKNEGKLMFNNRIPYNASMLANVTRFPVAVVEKAIAIFKELGLIEVLDNGAIYMLDIQNFIGKSSTEADRKRLYRSKIEEEKKSLGQMSGQLIGQMSDKTPPEIDIDIEKELEKEIDIYTDKKNCEDWIIQNDLYFNLNTCNEEMTERDINLIKQADDAVLTPDKHIQTKFGLGTIRNLSSGCKTLLNIIKHPDKVVCVEECGPNVLKIIFEMDNIKIYMSRPSFVYVSDNTKIRFNGDEIVTGSAGYSAWWSKEYERREKDDL